MSFPLFKNNFCSINSWTKIKLIYFTILRCFAFMQQRQSSSLSELHVAIFPWWFLSLYFNNMRQHITILYQWENMASETDVLYKVGHSIVFFSASSIAANSWRIMTTELDIWRELTQGLSQTWKALEHRRMKIRW